MAADTPEPRVHVAMMQGHAGAVEASRPEGERGRTTMLPVVASRIMPRTTLNLDASVLFELRRLQREENKPMGQLASELLARALSQERGRQQAPEVFDWVSAPMRARVDLEDDEAVAAALDESA